MTGRQVVYAVMAVWVVALPLAGRWPAVALAAAAASVALAGSAGSVRSAARTVREVWAQARQLTRGGRDRAEAAAAPASVAEWRACAQCRLATGAVVPVGDLRCPHRGRWYR